jgi:hypothetical protein
VFIFCGKNYAIDDDDNGDILSSGFVHIARFYKLIKNGDMQSSRILCSK